MVTWDDFDKIWASTSPLTPYEFSDPNYSRGWNFIGSTPPARQMWDSIQKKNDEKFKYLRDNFGTPNIVTSSSQMTDTDKVYVYMGSEAGWNSGHWYYWDGSAWADGGVYNSVAFITDTTLSIAGQPADAKATGDAISVKADASIVPVVDPTLTVSGAAADAKVTGEEIAKLPHLDALIQTVDNIDTINYGATVEYEETASNTVVFPTETVLGSPTICSVTNGVNNTCKFLSSIYNKSANLLDYTTLIANTYIDVGDNGVAKTAQKHYASGYIPIDDSNEYLTLSNKVYGINFCRIAFYNSSKQFISGGFRPLTGRVYTLEIPQNAHYVRVSNAYSNASAENVYLEVEYGDGNTPFVKYINETISVNTSLVRCGNTNTIDYGKDTISVKDGVVYFKKLYGHVVLDNTMNWYNGGDGDGYFIAYTTGFSSQYNVLTASPYSSFGQNDDAVFYGNTPNFDINSITLPANDNLSIKISTDLISGYAGASNLDKFKAYLADKPINFYYRYANKYEEVSIINTEANTIVYPNSIISCGSDFKLSATALTKKSPNNVVQLERADRIHYGGNRYTAFGGGCVVNGVEYYMYRCAKQHTTRNGEFGVIECYMHYPNGEWGHKNLENLGLSGGEFRDINVVNAYDNTNDIIVSGTFYTGVAYEYRNYVARLSTPDLTVKFITELVGSYGLFSWGNYLFNSAGNGMKCAYDQNFGGTGLGVFLLIENPNTNQYDRVQLFENSATTPNEASIGYFGNKLVVICRQAGAGALMKYTEDLTGYTGWSEAVELPMWAMAPNIQPYTAEGDPFILSFSSVTPDIVVVDPDDPHRDVSITATFDLVHWHPEKILAACRYYGGYNSFIKHGSEYSMTWYDDYNPDKPGYLVGTDLYYKRVNVYDYLTSLDKMKKEYNMS